MRKESILCFSLLFVLLGASFFVVFFYSETFTGLVGANVTFSIVSSATVDTVSSSSTSASSGGGGSSGGKSAEEEEEENETQKFSPEFTEKRNTVFSIEDAFTLLGASFSDLRVGDTLYFGSSEDVQEDDTEESEEDF